MRIALLALLALLLPCAPCLAQGNPAYDNLTVLGSAPTLTDEQGSTLTVMAFHTKYGEPVVGMYFVQNSTEVRFYANGATWDRLRQKLVKARDQWATLSAREFETDGAVEGYRIANRLATLRISLIGETDLASKRLQLSADGGASLPARASVALRDSELEQLVETLSQVDDFFRAAPSSGH